MAAPGPSFRCALRPRPAPSHTRVQSGPAAVPHSLSCSASRPLSASLHPPRASPASPACSAPWLCCSQPSVPCVNLAAFLENDAAVTHHLHLGEQVRVQKNGHVPLTAQAQNGLAETHECLQDQGHPSAHPAAGTAVVAARPAPAQDVASCRGCKCSSSGSQPA